MNLYKVDFKYCDYLYMFDKRVSINRIEKENRPFIGVILNSNGLNYFAPLTSPKKKHVSMKDSNDFIKIDNGRLGGINLNNMIPIPIKYVKQINKQQIEDEKYLKILYMQEQWININGLIIKNKAERLYNKIIENKADEQLDKRCCNFKLLEAKCYKRIYNESNDFIQEDEIKYCCG